MNVSILILLDYLFLYLGILYCIISTKSCLNPYFIGLPILINMNNNTQNQSQKSQSLFYWITYSYVVRIQPFTYNHDAVSILILLDYLFL